jgi:hypothetical protein
MEPTGTAPASKPVSTPVERAAIRDEGYDPVNPTVVAALDRVRAEMGGIQLGWSSSARPWSIWS